MILQLGVILGLVVTFTNDTLFQYGIPLAIYAALATAFGAQGIHLNVFHGIPAQKALAAGWLITCIINVLWILILSSEPSSLIYRYVSSNGRVSGTIANPNMAVQNVSTNLDAFANKYTTEGVVPEHQHDHDHQHHNGSAVGSLVGNSENRGSRVHSMGADPEGHRQRSIGVWSTPSQTPIRPGSMRDVPPVPESTVPPADVSEAGLGTRPTSEANIDQNRPISTNHTNPNMGPAPQQLPRALALFDYHASEADPYELSFKKGEVLEVSDRTGKWWEAIRTDGTRGIAPSNYLKLM
ncbi:hypothetical protein P691DRAFT_803062 [Macrolepiota fuliginosa MF-IS2]|uniref:SH3 domain-containing protein n=1 Tax=Macrolepiota fuliginosa MF-IS2 TaxID=1400762 RepID=A0A9P5XCZ8_9AGAR|nr:hypothetical protein P691DRAFT_803062 [Macrolepiota fuliginosa MF-IS2]